MGSYRNLSNGSTGDESRVVYSMDWRRSLINNNGTAMLMKNKDNRQMKDITISNCEFLKRPTIGLSYSCEILKDLSGLSATKSMKKLANAVDATLAEAGYEGLEQVENELEKGNFRNDQLARNTEDVTAAAKLLRSLSLVGEKHMELIMDCMLQSHAQLILSTELYKICSIRAAWPAYKNELRGDPKKISSHKQGTFDDFLEGALLSRMTIRKSTFQPNVSTDNSQIIIDLLQHLIKSQQNSSNHTTEHVSGPVEKPNKANLKEKEAVQKVKKSKDKNTVKNPNN
eukprot:GHVS01050994.1.p1 GENE.GHVS01050994.1~~GHVS01050994.1.p1  ORF type:complete len:285 (-),score=43.24 GHVS01050994.1:48-902(-)